MLTGSENTLSALIKTEMETAILADTGSAAASPNNLVSLGNGMAAAFIPHFVANVDITPGTFSTVSGPVTGIGGLL